MIRVMTLLVVSLLILVGCANLKDPMEPPDTAKDTVRRRPASPFYDATRPASDDGPSALAERSDEELEAFRDRQR